MVKTALEDTSSEARSLTRLAVAGHLWKSFDPPTRILLDYAADSTIRIIVVVPNWHVHEIQHDATTCQVVPMSSCFMFRHENILVRTYTQMRQ